MALGEHITLDGSVYSGLIICKKNYVRKTGQLIPGTGSALLCVTESH